MRNLRKKSSGGRLRRAPGHRSVMSLAFTPLVRPIVHRLIPELAILRLKHPMAFVREIQHFGRDLQDLQRGEKVEPLRNVEAIIVLAVHDQCRRFEIGRILVR